MGIEKALSVNETEFLPSGGPQSFWEISPKKMNKN